MDETVLDEGGQVYSNSTYFKDGRRKIDYVLVCHVLKTKDDITKLSRYLESLLAQGIEFETMKGLSDQNLNYVKLHAPKSVLQHIANIHNVILQCNSRRTLVELHKWNHGFFQTPLTLKVPPKKLQPRAPQTFSHSLPQVITSSERSLLIRKVLLTARYGDEEFDRGLANLMSCGVINEAFPIHDSSRIWKKDGYLSDFQLLSKYWANMGCLHKNQPLNLIRKYYGPEVAFYFAFADFYTKMLIPAAVIGVCVFIYNVVTWDLDGPIIKGICDSKEYLCAHCLNPNFCEFRKLKLFCNYSKVQTLFDNASTILFALFMSFWATIFLELWRRRETELAFTWNLMNVDSDMILRLKYEEETKYKQRSTITGKMEPYIPLKRKVFHYTITVLCFALIVIFVIFMVFMVMLIRQWLMRIIKISGFPFLNDNLTLISMSIGAILSVLVIKLCGPYYSKLAVKLTLKENPRTIVGFYNACIFKSYTLAFINSYFPLFYLAFVKGHFFTHPGDLEEDSLIVSLKTDVCHPAGCISSLSIQLIFLMICKTWVARLLVYIKPYIKRFTTIVKERGNRPISLPRWEEDQKKKDTGQLFLLTDYMELAIQYGFVTFFVSALPLAPLLALVSNVFEIRMDARKMLRSFRRPVPRRLPGIGAWNTILRLATFIGCIVNAFIIAFTSDIIPKLIYHYTHGNYTGFVNYTLTRFAVSDYNTNMTEFLFKIGKLETCVFRAERYNYDEEHKYELTSTYAHFMAFRMGFVVIFIQLIWALTSICAAAITDMPPNVAQDLLDEKSLINELRLRHLVTNKKDKIRKNYIPFRL